MKKLKIWSIMMLIVMALPLMVACGGDDDGGGNVDYTAEEIVNILTGSWKIYGHVTTKVCYAGFYNFPDESMIDQDYTGSIQFTADQKVTAHGPTFFEGKYYVNNGLESATEMKYAVNLYSLLRGTYSIYKSGGQTFIVINHYHFRIETLTKSSFRLICDGVDGLRNENIYLSIISQ